MRKLDTRWYYDKVKEALYKKQKGECAECEKELPIDMLTIDHIKPKMFGRDDRPENLQLLCVQCNQDKGAHLEADDVWYEHIAEVLDEDYTRKES